jgi:hypothetical protein
LEREYVYDGLLFSPKGVERLFAEFAADVGFSPIEESGWKTDRDWLTFTAFPLARDPE